MDPNELNGKSFAVVLSDEHGDETFFGTARWDGNALSVDRGASHAAFLIRNEWLERIQPVTSPVVRAVLNNADYWIRLQLGTTASGEPST